MDVSQTVVGGILMVLFVGVFVMMVEWMIPVYHHQQFSSLCRYYALVMEAENGLSLEREKEMKEELKALSLDEIEINATRPHGVQRHDQLLLEVQAIWGKGDQKKSFYYQQPILARMVFN